MPTGKVKFYDEEKGFGFISSEDGVEVFLHVTALSDGVTSVKPGSRVEFGVAEGKRGLQALSVRVIDSPSLAKINRPSPETMVPIVEDLIKLLDEFGQDFRSGRYPERALGRQVAKILRKLAEDLEA